MFYVYLMVLCDISYYGCKLFYRLNNKNYIVWSWEIVDVECVWKCVNYLCNFNN